jgi:hypothetical protein
MTSLAPIMQGFFTDRLADRRASEHTVAAYRRRVRCTAHGPRRRQVASASVGGSRDARTAG